MKLSPHNKHEPELLISAIRENCFRSIVPSNQVAGLQLAQLRHTTEGVQGATRIAEEFLLSSRLSPEDFEIPNSIRNYFNDPSQVMISHGGRFASARDKTTPLPAPTPVTMALGEAQKRRRSIREFTGDPISAADLAAILHGSSGITGLANNPLRSGGHVAMHYRAVASGGGLFPVATYMLALRVKSLDRGLYCYAPRDDMLVATDRSVEDVLAAVNLPDDQITGNEVAAIVLLVGRPWRSMRKYGARGLRYLLLEAGGMAHGIQLTVTALGLGGLDYGGFYDADLNESLGLDGRTEVVVHAILIGAI